MSKPLLLVILVVLAALAAGALFVLRGDIQDTAETVISPLQQEEGGLGEELYEQSGNPGTHVPESNPFEGEDNPFRQAETNPFEYTNPFE